MSKFIELTRESGDKVFVNVDRINTIQPVDDDRAFVFMMEEDCFDVTESYEQVKHLIETGEPLDIAENKTIDTKQAVEWLKQFDENQRFQLMEGIDDGVDVSLYAKLEFDWEQMLEIRFGQENGVDVTLYANPKFYWKQMQQIRYGLKSGIDVSLYLDPNIPWEQMQEIREKLEKEKQEQDSKIANEPLDDGKNTVLS